ncbi:MAG: ATP-binding cassette domain-containing protein [Pseudomonadota bacterium]
MTPALELRNLTKTFALPVRNGWRSTHVNHHAVRDVSLTLPRNAILGLVGESGSGKTTTGMMAMRLVEPSSGQILVDGTDITTMDHTALKPFRRKMQVVFQDSYSALDPMLTLGQIVAEPLHIHGVGTPSEQTDQALNWLQRVGLDRSYGNRYPHELSGGQRQRVAIARALILRPTVLVADEPTSALDVSVKAQIINLLLDLQAEMGLSILFISHDLSVVRSLTDKVAVMFNGRVVEHAPTEAIFTDARHPYTRSLLDAIPVLNPRLRRTRTFLSRADLAASSPRLNQGELAAPATASPDPQLVSVAPDHLVEAIVT